MTCTALRTAQQKRHRMADSLKALKLTPMKNDPTATWTLAFPELTQVHYDDVEKRLTPEAAGATERCTPSPRQTPWIRRRLELSKEWLQKTCHQTDRMRVTLLLFCLIRQTPIGRLGITLCNLRLHSEGGRTQSADMRISRLWQMPQPSAFKVEFIHFELIRWHCGTPKSSYHPAHK